MRRLLLALAVCAAPAAAQRISPTLPSATRPVQPAAVHLDTSTTSYTIDGIRVIHRAGAANLVVMNLYLLGGVRNATPETAGLEPMYLAVSEQGTERYPKDALRRAMARTGSGIALDATDDWTLFGIRTTTEELDSVWNIFTDRLMRPRLEPSEIDFVRNQMLSALRQLNENPDALLSRVADSVAFREHPYALSPAGSESSLRAMTRESLLQWKQQWLVKSRLLLVVVGNVPRATLERMITGSLGRLPAGQYAWTMPDTLPMRPSSLTVVPRALPTNYVAGIFRGPRANERDAAALRVASAVLSGQLFSEIRSKSNLTYTAAADFRDAALISGKLFVTTTLPDSALKIMRDQIRLLQEVNIPTHALSPLIQQFLTEYFLDNETSTAQADFLARAQLYNGDWQAANRFMAELRAVTGEDVRRVARRYLRNIQWIYIGDPARITRRLAESF
ncbi:MAG: insulinase family protein [Gemmatimonadaceae bacterium]|nr:insulinase family protein [Gemmatimonadaceae bacterium]